MNANRIVSLLAIGMLLIAVFTANNPVIAAQLPRMLAQSGAPQVVSYQGYVTLNGNPYSGTGYFKFALVNAAGDTTFWSNDGTSSTGEEPDAAVSINVSDGLFQVLLGDSALDHMTALPATAFDGTERYLRTWFSSDNVSFSMPNPDRRIAAVPYALQAEEAKTAATAGNADYATAAGNADYATAAGNADYATAAGTADYATAAGTADYATAAGDAGTLDGLDASAFWQLGGNAGTNPALHYLGTSDPVTLTLGVNGIGAAFLTPEGNLGLGTDTPAERLTVRGNVQVRGEEVPVARGVTSSSINRPNSVFVTGDYAYVVSFQSNALTIFDTTDPDHPVALGSISTNLWSPESVYVAGHHAYVTDPGNSRLAVFDVSDPRNPVAQGYTTTHLDMPWDVTVSGHYAYVASFSFSNPRLVIFDVSDPNNLVALGYIGTNLQRPQSVAVSGNYAYVTSLDNGCLAVFDVSNPSSIVSKGCFTNPGLSGAADVYIAGHYAYVTGLWNNSLVVYDISNPGNLVALGSTTTNLDSPVSVTVVGNYAFVASGNNDRLAVFDVSDPNNLVALGFTSANLDGPTSLSISGQYIYVTGYVNNVLAVYELPHLESPTADIGNLYTNNLHVGETAFVDENLNILGSLNVGQSALFNGDLAVQGNLFAHSNITTLTGSATLAIPQSGVVLINNAAIATITLPPAASAKGLTFTIKRLTANAVTVASAGGTIDGAATQALAAQYDFITVISDGSNWYIISK